MLRKPAVAGSFYPDNPVQLRREIESCLGSKKDLPVFAGSPVGLIVPHAGYYFSGAVAADAYRLAAGCSYDLVVVLAPSHQHYFTGVSIYSAGNYQTPLGEVEVDTELAVSLIAEHSGINFVPEAHISEHSLEVQLPFLQVIFNKITLLPLVLGQFDWAAADNLAEIIAQLSRKRRLLLIASTDLSHFHAADTARILDRRIVDAVAGFSPETFWSLIQNRQAEACGAGPLLTLMLAAGKMQAENVKILTYRHSGEICGDNSRVVGYLSAAIYANDETSANAGTLMEKAKMSKENSEQRLKAEEKEYLRSQVEKTIRARLEGGKIPDDVPESEILKEKCGGFVTLKKKGNLRGCIGYIEAYKPLYQTVREMAQAAAFDDPRFPEVNISELADIEIEISVLTPLREIDNPDIVEVGKHGLLIRYGNSSGLLLPQVPVEQGWNREEFLAHTCQKAGLAPDCWRHSECRLFIFSAEIF